MIGDERGDAATGAMATGSEKKGGAGLRVKDVVCVRVACFRYRDEMRWSW